MNRGNMSAPTKSEAKALFMTPDADLGVADDARGLSVKMQIFLTYAIGGLGSAWLWPHLEACPSASCCSSHFLLASPSTMEPGWRTPGTCGESNVSSVARHLMRRKHGSASAPIERQRNVV